ncbi:hypothetical protein AG1IA_03072 [Rhizoctonia solani AG-1 IA]|uniref:Uncharacterized protein n=1 Tax=Thanatephorus cucumeris (strain AG1-IA) TaxID=983506 RepID=L8X1C7_THACA|nr:hypothetical protein AG1IA_03072 [Rhizoctonia solani AG-1 IA]
MRIRSSGATYMKGGFEDGTTRHRSTGGVGLESYFQFAEVWSRLAWLSPLAHATADFSNTYY